MIAMLVSGNFRTKKGNTYPIWFPLIIIYLILAPLYVLAAIALLIMSMFGSIGETARNYLKLFFSLPKVFSALIGTTVKVENRDADFELRIT